MMTDEEIVEVVQAKLEGKKIQAQRHGHSTWHDLIPRPLFQWNFWDFDYRVKSEPLGKYRLECWANQHDDGGAMYYPTPGLAESCVTTDVVRTAVHMREVKNDD